MFTRLALVLQHLDEEAQGWEGSGPCHPLALAITVRRVLEKSTDLVLGFLGSCGQRFRFRLVAYSKLTSSQNTVLYQSSAVLPAYALQNK